jgi:hypothetical protein
MFIVRLGRTSSKLPSNVTCSYRVSPIKLLSGLEEHSNSTRLVPTLHVSMRKVLHAKVNRGGGGFSTSESSFSPSPPDSIVTTQGRLEFFGHWDRREF